MDHIVIGMGFGDESKGHVTDWLSAKLPNPIVVRFNGGHQAGHTVVRNGIRHIFSNFGSGTINGTPTYWSKYCTVEPVGLFRELNLLNEKTKALSVWPKLFINIDCPITTPYDIEANRRNTATLGHGSCGVGFGETIKREENSFHLHFADLFYPQIYNEKLEEIRKYYRFDPDEIKITDFIYSCILLKNTDYIKPWKTGLKNIADKYDSVIYEGAQGLMLDQDFGFFPNVTRSKTGTNNICDMRIFNQSPSIYLVTRAYQTRHGSGYMSNTHLAHNIKEDENETNISNTYQGNFRRTILDIDLLKYVMEKDHAIRTSANLCLVITCLDHIKYNNYLFTLDGQVIRCSNENEFVSKISNELSIKNVFVSHGPSAEDIQPFECLK